VAECVRRAIDAGLAGCSIEDHSGDDAEPIYALDRAVDRVRAAADAAGGDLVLTARAENYLHGRPDLADTITRLQRFQEAGADVLYAPGLTGPGDLRTLLRSVDRPVNVLALPGAPTVGELAELGVARISVGGAFAFAALGALAEAGRELLGPGTYGFWDRAATGRELAGEAFDPA
jgi:2-methylisocitrate lyase-like PEP mutase family enzyme